MLLQGYSLHIKLEKKLLLPSGHSIPASIHIKNNKNSVVTFIFGEYLKIGTEF